MLLRLVDGTEFRDMPIKEGEMFLLPGKSILLMDFQPHHSKCGMDSQYPAQSRKVRGHHWDSDRDATTGKLKR